MVLNDEVVCEVVKVECFDVVFWGGVCGVMYGFVVFVLIVFVLNY